jgi:hypothetical protein
MPVPLTHLVHQQLHEAMQGAQVLQRVHRHVGDAPPHTPATRLLQARETGQRRPTTWPLLLLLLEHLLGGC